MAGDPLNMVSFGTLGTLPIRLANARFRSGHGESGET